MYYERKTCVKVQVAACMKQRCNLHVEVEMKQASKTCVKEEKKSNTGLLFT